MARTASGKLAAQAATAVQASTAVPSQKSPPDAGPATPAEEHAAPAAATRAPASARKGRDGTPRRPARSTRRTSGTSAPAPAAAGLPVKPGEDPWTEEELAEVRAELQADSVRLADELALATRELDGLMRDAGDGAGNDQADMGSTTFERDHELSLANNARGLLLQTGHALERIADGSYGRCESCSQPIGKNRLMAFPRATLCLTCKQREERR